MEAVCRAALDAVRGHGGESARWFDDASSAVFDALDELARERARSRRGAGSRDGCRAGRRRLHGATRRSAPSCSPPGGSASWPASRAGIARTLGLMSGRRGMSFVSAPSPTAIERGRRGHSCFDSRGRWSAFPSGRPASHGLSQRPPAVTPGDFPPRQAAARSQSTLHPTHSVAGPTPDCPCFPPLRLSCVPSPLTEEASDVDCEPSRMTFWRRTGRRSTVAAESPPRESM